jgi:hypothetical protein
MSTRRKIALFPPNPPDIAYTPGTAKGYRA